MIAPMEPVAIRDATLADLDALRDIFRRSSLANEGDRPHLLAHPEVLVLPASSVEEHDMRVAEVDGRIVGFATAYVTDADAVELDDLFVDPDWMRRGIATLLVADLVVRTRAAGSRRIEVTANDHAMAFYEQAGFFAVGEVATRFGAATRMHRGVDDSG